MRIALSLCLSLSVLSICEVSAQDPCAIIWDAPILLSDTTYNAHSPHIALSGDDTVHIVWYGGGTRLPYVRSTNGGQGFEQTVELLADSVAFPFDANRPSIVSWKQNVYAFFQGATASIHSPIRMVKSTTGGSSWGYPVDISPDSAGPPPLTPTIMGDTIAMTYVPLRQVTHNILRSTNAGATWVSANAGLPNFSIFALGSRSASNCGALHLVQIGVVGNQGEIEYRRSHDLGDTWVQQTFLSSLDGLSSIDPIIGVSSTPGDLSIESAWRDPKYGCIGLVGCSVLGRRGVVEADSTVWNPEQVLTDIPAGYEPKVSAHHYRVAAAWPMDQESAPFAEVRVSDDTSWCSVFDPTTGITTRAVITVEVALSSKAVHVVWSANQAPSPGTFRIFYRRGRFIDTDVREESGTPPMLARLQQNYPNPFNPATTIPYALPERGFVSLRIYNFLGQEITALVNTEQDAGDYEARWEPKNQSSGMYFYQLSVSGRATYTKTRAMILLR